jgi:hypothetical protein
LASVITPGQHVDSLEFLGSQGDCQPVSALSTAPVTGTAINTVSVVPACYAATQPVLISYPGGFTKPGYATMTTVGTPPPAGRATFAATQPAWSQVPDAACLVCARPPVAGSCGGCTVTNPTGFSTLGMYRYQIAPDTDGTPSLWRSSSGGCGVAAGVFACVAPPSAQGGWQQVARGIEDLQVRYMDGGGAWADTPTVSDCGANCNASPTATVPTTAEYNTITRQIEVVLSGRAVAPGPRLQGAMESDQGAAVRGQLRTVIVPRGVLINLNSAVNVQWR